MEYKQWPFYKDYTNDHYYNFFWRYIKFIEKTALYIAMVMDGASTKVCLFAVQSIEARI